MSFENMEAWRSEEREELTPISDALGDIIEGLNKQISSLTQELKDKTEALEKIAQVGNIRTERRKNEKS